MCSLDEKDVIIVCVSLDEKVVIILSVCCGDCVCSLEEEFLCNCLFD